MATFFDKQSGKAERTAEQIEHKKQLLAEKVKQMNAICKELVEAGVLELSENELDKVNGGLPLFCSSQRLRSHRFVISTTFYA